MTLRRRAKFFLYNSVPGFAGRFPYYGTTVHFPPGAPLFRWICEQGRFEPEIIDRLVALARPRTTVFDIGANIGLMAVPVLQGCATCRVVSFEPSPNSLPFLQQTAGGSAHADRWTVIGKALATKPGELDFTVGAPADAPFEGFKSGDSIPGARTVKVPVSTLDAEWQALGRPEVSVIKIDVEGAEGLVLDGGAELLRAQRPAILIEWYEAYLRRFGTPPARLVQLARDAGYTIYTVPAGVTVPDAQSLFVQMMACQNFLLLPPTSP